MLLCGILEPPQGGALLSTANAVLTEPGVRAKDRKERDPSIDYLRAFVVLLVLVAHCGLAYCYMVRYTPPWNALVPIVDLGGASIFFDYIFNFADVCLMGLMFFLSALFAYPAMRRHGLGGFLRDRFLRLGLPFLGAISLVLPLGYYGSWLLQNPGQSYGTFWIMLAHHRFGATGPMWFLWVLLLLDCMLSVAFLLFRGTVERLGPWLDRLQEAPIQAVIVLLGAIAVAYLPLFAHYGYSGGWKIIFLPFMLQPSKFLVYVAWSVAGFLVGSRGIEHGLIARSGALVRRWPAWAALGAVAFNALWLVPRLPLFSRMPLIAQHAAVGLLWVLADVSCVLGLVALFRGLIQTHKPVFDSLSRNSYAIYLVHYIFVIWTQRMLLAEPISIYAKFAISFVATLILSWLTGMVLTRIPGLRRVL